ncbi:hypothetical protein GL4_3187 [Methyloceanibacter caenitepidi]|uniref:Uncharacterized protein n=1 Tax=Methyloceanibacter caenitepidi TaxID=1384459 RepID=A0A0A8K6P0_9HYPH|nr:hypothetical protein GL4_3187 [Methyloceanibacter caenitepidi]
MGLPLVGEWSSGCAAPERIFKKTYRDRRRRYWQSSPSIR